jgi:hypothetical protein
MERAEKRKRKLSKAVAHIPFSHYLILVLRIQWQLLICSAMDDKMVVSAHVAIVAIVLALITSVVDYLMVLGQP